MNGKIGQNILNYHNKGKPERYSKKDQQTPRNIRLLQHMIMQNTAKSCNKKSQSYGTVVVI